MAWQVVGLLHKTTQVLYHMIFSYFDAARKLRIEIHGVKSSQDQTRALRDRKENPKSKIASLGLLGESKQDKTKLLSKKKDIANQHKGRADATDEKEEQKEEMNIDYEKQLYSLEESFERIKKQEEKEIKECSDSYAKNKTKQEKEIKEFNENHARNIQKMEEKFEMQINELRELGNRLKLKEPGDKHYYLAYIELVCSSLQTNMYHFVLPDHFAENWLYRVKDIEKDINDEDLLGEDERKEALKRWKDLKEKLGWDPSLERTLKMLQQKDGYSIDQPEELTVEEAERVAEELDKQGRLRGRTSYEKVKKIIEMWRKSADLVR